MAAPGNMMNRPLLVSSILAHAANNNPRQLIVTAMGGGVIHRYTYTEFARRARQLAIRLQARSEEHTSELQSLMRISYAVFCLKNKNTLNRHHRTLTSTLH